MIEDVQVEILGIVRSGEGSRENFEAALVEWEDGSGGFFCTVGITRRHMHVSPAPSVQSMKGAKGEPVPCVNVSVKGSRGV